MSRRLRIGLVVAALFTAGNLVSAGFALDEPLHAGGHLLLALLGAAVVWRLALSAGAGRSTRLGAPVASDARGVLTDRLRNLEQSVDAVAIEVERIGEGQRFMTRVFTERKDVPRSNEVGAEPIETRTPTKSDDAS